MDPRLTAPAASSPVFPYANIAKAIKDVTEKYKAAPKTLSISGECSTITAALMDVQMLLSQPHALSSRVISQIQLVGALKNAQNRCSFTISKLEEEVEKCTGNQKITAESPGAWSMTHLCDEVLIKRLLQQIQMKITDVSLLIVAAQR